MVGLIDIAPACENVTVGTNKIPVYGVSAKGIAYLLQRFPQLRKLMTGKSVDEKELFAMGADAVSAIIATGCGYIDDEKAEAKAAGLSIDAQADLLSAVMRLTMPGGVGPFVEKLGALGGLLNADVPSVAAPVTKSPKLSKAS